jgi:hypothetical protein
MTQPVSRSGRTAYDYTQDPTGLEFCRHASTVVEGALCN